MTTETETKKAQPTLAELEGKVQRLTNQVASDGRLVSNTGEAFRKAVKSGNVDEALATSAGMATAKSVLNKSQTQLKTAENAVKSAKHAANADKIAAIHDDVRDGKLTAAEAFAKLEPFGITQLRIERSEETGKLIVNSIGPSAPKRMGSGGGGGGGRGQSLTVDGKVFDSASAALTEYFPDFTGKMGRAAIITRLQTAGHEVS